ncbi:MAG: PEP-CTERM sorting domain-containing protein [Verrucomicrobiota bacterium]|nr:PEP-CTERM sorting domain-containing protein [Verrucomicrobiota bacterium]
MKSFKSIAALAFAGAFFIPITKGSAQTLFSDNFDIDHTANWTKNFTTGNNAADIFFDYSTIGIPSAPNSVGGTTRGVKMESDFDIPGVLGGVSISPTGQSFLGNYRLKYDVWHNYNGPLGPINAGGSGSTQYSGGGILSSGTTAEGNNTPGLSSILFTANGDSGSGIDYRVYTSAGLAPDASTNYAASGPGNRSGANAYYSSFGNTTAPAAQQTLFPQQTGSTPIGSQGFAWHQVEIEKIANIVTWKIDGLLIATVDTNGLTLGGNNIFLDRWEQNASVSTDPNRRALLFGLVDNVRVEAVPEPATYAMGLLGMAGLYFARRRK